MKTLILGLGNPIRGDDGVGIRVAEELRRQIKDEDIEVQEASVGGLGILDLIQGYDKVIIVDSIQTKDGQPGQIHRLKPSDLKSYIHTSWPHEVNLTTTLSLGDKLQLRMPKIINIYAVEIKDDITFAEECTPEISKVVPKVVHQILSEEFGPV
ncbi:MAG: hydrogenase maturation protease [Deltaproteobacteria bacterium]|nr:MAG: hydrogenase maturation protease [Deltaproteobacteria bacterium]